MALKWKTTDRQDDECLHVQVLQALMLGAPAAQPGLEGGQHAGLSAPEEELPYPTHTLPLPPLSPPHCTGTGREWGARTLVPPQLVSVNE